MREVNTIVERHMLAQVLGDFQMGAANAISTPYVPNWVEITRRVLRQAVEQVGGKCAASPSIETC